MPERLSITQTASTRLMCGEQRLQSPALSVIRMSKPSFLPQSTASAMLLMKKWSGHTLPEKPTWMGIFASW